MAAADSNEGGGSCEIKRNWRGSNWFDTAVEMCEEVGRDSE